MADTATGGRGRRLSGADPEAEFLRRYRLAPSAGGKLPEDSAPDSSPDSSPDSAPDSSAPDSSAPDSFAPDSSAPDSSAPDSFAPDSSAPDSSAPVGSGNNSPRDQPGHGSVSPGETPAPEPAARPAVNGGGESGPGWADSGHWTGPPPGGSVSRRGYAKHGLTSRTGRQLPPVPSGAHRLSKAGERGDGGREKAPLELPPRQPSGSGTGTARHRVNKAGASSTIPEVEIAIPNDGCLASFSADAMAGFFRHLRLDDRLVTHLHRNGLDGRRFGRLKDTDLDNLRLNNPVIVYFRDRTAPVANKKSKQRIPFVLDKVCAVRMTRPLQGQGLCRENDPTPTGTRDKVCAVRMTRPLQGQGLCRENDPTPTGTGFVP
ncbi:hypothetical protein ACOMHN_049170 [Nucella lapillus]